MGRIQNRVPIRVYPIEDPGLAGRIRNRIPWLVDVVDSADDGDILNVIPVNVIEVTEYPGPIHNVTPRKVFLDPEASSISYKGNAEPIRVYVVSGSLAMCPSGSTVDGNGDTSNLHITIVFCDDPRQVGEASFADGVSLEVNGSSVGWTLSNPQSSGSSITYDVNQSLDSTDVIQFVYDGSWAIPADAFTISVRNLMASLFLVATITGDFLVDTDTGFSLIGVL